MECNYGVYALVFVSSACKDVSLFIADQVHSLLPMSFNVEQSTVQPIWTENVFWGSILTWSQTKTNVPNLDFLSSSSHPFPEMYRKTTWVLLTLMSFIQMSDSCPLPILNSFFSESTTIIWTYLMEFFSFLIDSRTMNGTFYGGFEYSIISHFFPLNLKTYGYADLQSSHSNDL